MSKGYSTRSIEHQSIFGEYFTDEDRVTAALLQILRIGGPELMNAVFEDFDISFDAEVNTQVSKESKSRPDGELKANYHLFIESKVKKWVASQHNLNQLSNHFLLAKKENANLLYITPDVERPADLNAYQEVFWTNWKDVVERLKRFESTFNRDIMSFLAAQFEMLVDNVVFSHNDGCNKENRVIIVGGHFAEENALTNHFYSCQPGRSFREARYISFYHKKRIKYVFRIKSDPVQVNSLEDVRHLLPLDYSLTAVDKTPHTFFELEEGEALPTEILHEEFGPFVRGQRYTSIYKIREATTTKDL